MKNFNLLSLGLLLLFSLNLMADDFITLKDGRRFRITEVLGDFKHGIMSGIIGGKGISIQTRVYTQSIEDGGALYVGKDVSLDTEEIDIICGNTVYKLDKLKPGYYLRDGEKLLYAESVEE